MTTPSNRTKPSAGNLASLGWPVKEAAMTESRRMVAFQRLGAALGTTIAGETRFDNAARAAYASDASNYRQVPVGVVLREASRTSSLPSRCAASMAPRAAAPEPDVDVRAERQRAVVIDCSKYLDRVLGIDPAASTARVEPAPCATRCVRRPKRRTGSPSGPTRQRTRVAP